MHLQQTKRGSRGTGGPQYYFHNLRESIKTYLRNKGGVRVALVTPYGATKSNFFAVGKEHKLDSHNKITVGSVGHDRIQQGIATESIGEAIRRWYNIPSGDFERIDIEIDEIDNDFYLAPTSYKMVGGRKKHTILKVERPLTFTNEYISRFWRDQIANLKKNKMDILKWSCEEISRVITAHKPKAKLPHVQEADLLRSSGPLKHLGVALGAYVGKGYDCLSDIRFMDYPQYTVPIEIKRFSKHFSYQLGKYGKTELSRAVILCAYHNLGNVPKNIDVLELDSFCNHLLNI